MHSLKSSNLKGLEEEGGHGCTWCSPHPGDGEVVYQPRRARISFLPRAFLYEVPEYPPSYNNHKLREAACFGFDRNPGPPDYDNWSLSLSHTHALPLVCNDAPRTFLRSGVRGGGCPRLDPQALGTGRRTITRCGANRMQTRASAIPGCAAMRRCASGTL